MAEGSGANNGSDRRSRLGRRSLVHRRERRPRQRRGDRQQRADGDERGAITDQVDEERRRDRAEGDRDERDALHRRERAREHLIGYARWRSVSPETSTTVFATPIAANAR